MENTQIFKRYDVRFCHCGHLIFIPSENWNWINEDPSRRQVIVACTHCGATFCMSLTECTDGICCNMAPVTEDVFEPSMHRRFIFTEGTAVPVRHNGKPCGFADYHNGTAWFCGDKRVEVDTEYLIQMVKDPEKLHAAAGYISGIKWGGTKYAI